MRIWKHRAGEPAPVDGMYRAVTRYGQPLGIEIKRLRGEPFPPNPVLNGVIGIDVRYILIKKMTHIHRLAA